MRGQCGYGVAVAVGLSIGGCKTDQEAAQQLSAAATPPVGSATADEATVNFADLPPPVFKCESGTSASGDTVSVRGSSHELRNAPNGKAAKIVNRKATDVLGETQYQVIDDSTRVQLQCVSGDWARVKIVDPEWLAGVNGWVKRSVLVIPSKTGEERGFVEQDISWDKDTRKYKAVILQALNKIHREDRRCVDSMTASTVSLSSKSSPGKPVFFVACGQGMETVNVFFSPADIASGKTFSAPVHIDHLRATNLCEEYAKSHSTHPSTVDFSRFMSLGIMDHANGRTTVQSKFTAKNAFGVELEFNIRCLLDSSGLLEATITE